MPRRLDRSRLRSFVASLIPPLLLRAVLRQGPDFRGVHASFSEVPDEDPWSGPYWIGISRQKLEQVATAPRRTVPPGVHANHALVTLVANGIAAREGCRVLDFGGGTGFVYFAVRDVLAPTVTWHVVDAPHLARMARDRLGDDPRLTFSDEIPQEPFDVVYVNTTLQYIEHPRPLLEELTRQAPEAVVLTRLMAGDVPDWVTTQTIGGRRTPCRFLNLPSLLSWFAERGYVDELRSVEDSFEGAFARDVPEHLRIPYDVNLVLRRAP